MNSGGTGDRHVQALQRLFLEHPAWIAAGDRIAEGATSDVSFSHRPRERWHFVRESGKTLLRKGAAPDPDFAFRFSPASIERLASVEGGMGEIAVTLFTLMEEADGNRGVGFRIVAPFSRLVRRGYVRLLLDAGPRVIAFGLARGVATLKELRRLVGKSRDKRS